MQSETAFQQEIVLLAGALPLAWLLADTWHGYAILIGAVLFLILVEVINTAVEAACDAVSREFRPEIQLAKDCGSLAVAFAIFLSGGVWLFFVLDWWHGAPV